MRYATLLLTAGLLVVAPSLVAQQGSGLDQASLDPAVPPCQDFFHYANGGWIRAHPIPAEYPRWGTFNALAEENRAKQRDILEALARRTDLAPGSPEKKLSDYWCACMDEKAVEAAGVQPVQPELDAISAAISPQQLQVLVARLQREGVRVLFNLSSEQDRKDSDRMIATIQQGGLGLPDRDYYLNDDERSKQIRAAYLEHIARMFGLLGDDVRLARTEAETVMSLETELARVSMSRVDRRDPDKTYHPMRQMDLVKLTPGFDWEGYFVSQGAHDATLVNVAQPDFIQGEVKLLGSHPLGEWRLYLRWHLLNAAAPYLSSAFVQEDFQFKGKVLQGTEKLEERWKRCVAGADRHLGFALGKLWVEKYFPPQAKEQADRLVKNLIAALKADLGTLEWMSPATRKAAIAKLEAFTPKIGYPEKWRDYSSYVVKPDSYADNALRGESFEFRRVIDKIGKPVDRTEWTMTPPTVNAYYSPPRNEIVFPAGILQPPFFDPKADEAVNYGAIGAVIGHEMTHGFDDQGRKFDLKGNLKDWWTPEDARSYEARAACVERQASAFEVQPGLHENGKLVLGESIADLGGLAIAHKAYLASLAGRKPPVIDSLSGDQRFFLGFARVWASASRPEFEQLAVKTDPHPSPRLRAVAAPSNMPEFAAAFSCKPGDPMVRTEVCKIW
jgi:putative endopeptidase